MPERSELTPASEAINRRGVMKGAAWSVPVMAVAVATPAASASACAQTYAGTVRFAAVDAAPVNYTRGTGANATLAGAASVALPAVNGFTTGAVNVTFSSSSLTSAATGGTYARDTRNFAADSTIAPGKFAIVQTVTGASVATQNPVRGQTVDIAFSRPVTGLSFRLEGITAGTTYNDAVTLTTVTGAALAATASSVGAQVAGNGTAANPWRSNAENANQGTITAANSLVVTIPGTISSLRLRYNSWGGTTTTAQAQGVFLGNMTFTTRCS